MGSNAPIADRAPVLTVAALPLSIGASLGFTCRVPSPAALTPVPRMETNWLLLTCRLPDDAPRTRASLWHDIHSLGALSLGEGGWVLPERPETASALRALTSKVREFGGEAALDRVRLDAAQAADVIGRSRAARAAELAEIARQAESLLEDMRHRTTIEDFTLPVLELFEMELAKLTRRAEQVRARDYFGVPEAHRVAEVLGRCEEAAAAFLEDVARREEPPS